jgi:hypothetical protein
VSLAASGRLACRRAPPAGLGQLSSTYPAAHPPTHINPATKEKTPGKIKKILSPHLSLSLQSPDSPPLLPLAISWGGIAAGRFRFLLAAFALQTPREGGSKTEEQQRIAPPGPPPVIQGDLSVSSSVNKAFLLLFQEDRKFSIFCSFFSPVASWLAILYRGPSGSSVRRSWLCSLFAAISI